MSEKSLRMGVSGLGGRGQYWIEELMRHPGLEVVAATDITPMAVDTARPKWPHLTYYDDVGKMLEHDLDGLVIASPAFMHTSDAVQALNAGKHVVSDVTACWTMAEAVQLYEAAQTSQAVYMFGENYCFFPFTQEMRRLFLSGVAGNLLYTEGHYYAAYTPLWVDMCRNYLEWRNWMPQSYYTSHVVGPLLYMTGLRPLEVTGFGVPPSWPSLSIGKLSDEVATFVLKLSNGAVATIVSNFHATKGEHLWWHLSGDVGEIENDRYGQFNEMSVQLGGGDYRHYVAEPPYDAEAARAAGHGGADFYVVDGFRRAVRGEAPPPIGAKLACEMSMPGILAHRSALAGGVKLEIPDLDDPAARDKYRNDTATPFTKDGHIGDVPPSTIGVPEHDQAWYHYSRNPYYADPETGEDAVEKDSFHGAKPKT